MPCASPRRPSRWPARSPTRPRVGAASRLAEPGDGTAGRTAFQTGEAVQPAPSEVTGPERAAPPPPSPMKACDLAVPQEQPVHPAVYQVVDRVHVLTGAATWVASSASMTTVFT